VDLAKPSKMKRRLLRRMVRKAFECTTALYEQQLVNSERSLQAVMWHELRQQFIENKKSTYKIFIEPRLVLPGSRSLPDAVRIPDLVVCNKDRVIAVIELKFKPRGRPGSTKDINTFSLLANTQGLEVANTRWEGDRRSVGCYPIEESALFVWAAIGKSTGAGGVDDESVKSRYLRLVYSTRDKTIS